EGERAAARNPKGQAHPARRHRRQDRMQSDAVGEPNVRVRHRVVEATTSRRGEPGGQPTDLAVAAEAHLCALEPATAVDPYLVWTVDEDVGHARLVQQPIERTGTDQLTAQCLYGREYLRRTTNAGLLAHECSHPRGRRRCDVVGEPTPHLGDQGSVERQSAAVGRQPTVSTPPTTLPIRSTGASVVRSRTRSLGNVSEASYSRQNCASGPRP